MNIERNKEVFDAIEKTLYVFNDRTHRYDYRPSLIDEMTAYALLISCPNLSYLKTYFGDIYDVLGYNYHECIDISYDEASDHYQEVKEFV